MTDSRERLATDVIDFWRQLAEEVFQRAAKVYPDTSESVAAFAIVSAQLAQLGHSMYTYFGVGAEVAMVKAGSEAVAVAKETNRLLSRRIDDWLEATSNRACALTGRDAGTGVIGARDVDPKAN
jgi:hypothetical protein